MTSRRAKHKGGVDEVERGKNRTKARVRSKVEWPFRILKRVFGFTKVRYRGLKKNHQWLLAAFALVNLYQNRKRLVPLGGNVSGGRKSASRDKNNPAMLALKCNFSRNSGCNCVRTSWHRNHAAKSGAVQRLLNICPPHLMLLIWSLLLRSLPPFHGAG